MESGIHETHKTNSSNGHRWVSNSVLSVGCFGKRCPDERYGCNVVIEYQYGHVWIVAAALAYAILGLLVVRSIVDRAELTSGWKLFWVLTVLTFPVIGFLAWFVAFKMTKPRKD